MVAVTERWNQFARVRQDLFGFIDLLAIRGDEVLAIQTTTAANMSARHAKLISLPAVNTWIASPNRSLVIHGWAKRGQRGKRKLWSLKQITITPLENVARVAKKGEASV